MVNEDLLSFKITQAAKKKERLFEESASRYALRSFNAGMYLSLGTMVAVGVGEYMNQVHPSVGKFLYSFMFAWGLVMIIFLNGELATSNMMYLSAATMQKDLSVARSSKILIACTLFNLLAAIVFAFLFSHTTFYSGIGADHYLFSIVQGKLDKAYGTLFLEGILANILVNIAILGSLRLKEEVAKMLFALAAITIFVFLGLEHVIANFIYFPLAYFTDPGNALEGFTLAECLIQWVIVFFGNLVGGGILIGLNYAWLNRTDVAYYD